MPSWKVHKYADVEKSSWDDFVRKSKNGTFLFLRDYMDYHRDRFEDHSLMIRDDSDQLVAILPANAEGEFFASHRGLTYGGIVSDKRMTAERILDVFEAVRTHLSEAGFRKMLYKTVPSLYHTVPAEEDRYALFRNNAELTRRDVLSIIDYTNPLPLQERRKRAIKKAAEGGLTIEETTDFTSFWEILSENLESRYGVSPTHTLEEIHLLAGHFPDQMKLTLCYRNNTLLAGAVTFLTSTVCHVQYNAANEEGRKSGALDYIFDHLVRAHKDSMRYFDFGISTEEDGRNLNAGLVNYKEGFGARTMVHDYYTLPLG